MSNTNAADALAKAEVTAERITASIKGIDGLIDGVMGSVEAGKQSREQMNALEQIRGRDSPSSPPRSRPCPCNRTKRRSKSVPASKIWKKRSGRA
ncbi:protein of unknown function [Magnetospirillum gryphiswaldense MSR-1 v2]|uniref:Uncharacterized protein n=1 Tax=Magnetospirillum gryphiswaldense (strain DSM 6361 / JCM 21280 / NBRC 15271 / MSR-1) TaxID=431944 RepID=V6F333_MAGGM|nr:protein of unknown function [Magnetospirillum gryphiswaldense MSR-1 v2]